ncbi:fungal specific transcription factor domain-containing protein [Hirsutella rhossiliensis]|uniref:Fungal specific transcription factor domain-containing protein n=1 Tax=Hirsutella rhossiliensis TaxID=111463 RepID=A0A9P8SI20_9HYPO|nr:fungal specific transcription factor domain-containing protein [Hirsutella rhossiliensis]KAH0961566.1 fungal specific transcription factor domain-containing protein [Hirsutella rhossiliensis]
MELIETQASDLRYLAQAPVALSDTASVSYDTPQPLPQASPPGSGSASFGENSAANANKRKPPVDDGDGQKQTRSKRNRYISIACNECKRRKIKCNGETPCQRCGNLNLTCLYAPNCCPNNFKDTDDFKNVLSQVARLQDEVSWLGQTVRTLAPPNDRATGCSSSAVASSPSQSSASAQRPNQPSQASSGPFRGPTSIAYGLDVANSTIANMGWRGISETDNHDQQPARVPMPTGNAPRDPLFEFDKDEMVRLCQFHEDETGIMYPVLNIHTVSAHAKNIAPFLESARNQQRPLELLNDEKTLQLKMILCCALAVEEHGHSDKAAQLYESMEVVVNRKLMADVSDVANLPLLCLLAGYRFLSNDEVLAWRVMGQVVRLCVELGIHQKRGLMRIQDESERKNALNSFWSAYVLDRRWGFATGLPFAVQDDEIDPQLPFPDEYPFLVAMITYSRLGAKVWRQVSHFGPVLARELRQEEIDNLDGEILQWYETIPEEVKVRNWDKEKQITSTPSYNLQRLRIWTYLRLNQIRIWLYTPILYSATSIMSNLQQARRVVDLAKDTIQYLNHLNSTTNLYRRMQVFYHQFLTSAIAVVFLASVHAPLHFSAVCREEFYMALDLVKDLSAKSWISKRLWRTIKSLKDVAPRFGLNPDDDAHSSAALGMIGLARGHLDPPPAAEAPFPSLSIPTHQQQVQGPQLRQNGKQLQNELSRIFEGYVGLNAFQLEPGEEQLPAHSELTSPESGESMFAADGTVFSQLRDMF